MRQPQFEFATTDEQEAICACEDDTLVVNAYAGCAKTSTLVEYARRRPDMSFLYLAFNAANKADGKRKFPSNVRCETTHALAYRAIGSRYRYKLGNPRPYHLAKAFGWDMISSGKVLEIVNNFLSSTAKGISEQHLPASIESKQKKTALKMAGMAWRAMLSYSDGSVPMPHDGYYKLYHLSSPQIRGFDYILLDEAQDTSPLAAEIISAQDTRKIIVGDKYQSIYSFRRAINAMNAFQASQTLRLSSSFRFGPGLAALASALLYDWRNETTPLRGLGAERTQWQVDENAPHAVIARTNAGLFDAAVGVLESGHAFGFVGDVKNYKFDLVLDAYLLYSGARGSIKDGFMRSFDNWWAMMSYANEIDDKELKVVFGLVEKYKSAIPSLIERIKTGARPALRGDEIALTTAHKSKGMEWDAVKVLDDFAELGVKLSRKGDGVEIPSAEEINLHYVAWTRAKKAIQCNSDMVRWIGEQANEKLRNAVLGCVSL